MASPLVPPYLCAAARYGEIRWALYNASGTQQHAGTSEASLGEFLAGHHEAASLALGLSADRETELESLDAESLPPMRYCSWNDAALAGALSGKPGVRLTMDHWIPLSGGCHSSEETADHGGQAMALAREANHRTVSMVHPEASIDWLTRQALILATPAGGLKGFNLQRVSRTLLPFSEQPPSPERARRIAEQVRNLADFPGPEPACLGLLSKVARRLSDLMRQFCSRVRLSESRAVWADGPLEGPLWNALNTEFRRYLPGLHWTVPDHPPEKGLFLLLLGENKEIERQSLNPNQPLPPERAGDFSDGAWRQLARGQVRIKV